MTTEKTPDGTSTIELIDLALPAEPAAKVTGGIATNQSAEAISLTNVTHLRPPPPKLPSDPPPPQ